MNTQMMVIYALSKDNKSGSTSLDDIIRAMAAPTLPLLSTICELTTKCGH